MKLNSTSWHWTGRTEQLVMREDRDLLTATRSGKKKKKKAKLMTEVALLLQNASTVMASFVFDSGHGDIIYAYDLGTLAPSQSLLLIIL